MPSPICTVNGSSATNGVNVTSGSLITIQLVDSTGVNSWSISCTNTDNRLSAATITAAMSVNQSTKTATLTMPSQACALQFTSVINNGVDASGTAQPSYTTTLGVFILTAGSLRMLFTNETTESSQTYGWISDVNSVVLAGLTSTNATAIQGNAIAPTILGAGSDGYMMEWVNANNDIEWKLVADKNVAANAAIAGTKISPAFGAQNISNTGTVSVGSTSGVNAIVGGINDTYITISGNRTVDTGTTDNIIRATLSLILTLPAPTTGRVIQLIIDGVTNNTTVNVSIARHAAENINGAASTLIVSAGPGALTGYKIVCDGTNWWVFIG